jgi:hypothetical protein
MFSWVLGSNFGKREDGDVLQGPTTLEMPKIAPFRLTNTGRLCNGTINIVRTMAPPKIPDAPRPATARPTMKTGELGAAPQMADPTSNRKMQVRKTLFGE